MSCDHRSTLDQLRRDLHDQVGSVLAGMAMQLELAEQVTTGDPAQAHQILCRFSAEVFELVGQVRSLVSPANPQCRVGSDLDTALTTMTDRMNTGLRGRLHVELALGGNVGSVPERIGSSAFWIVREALANVVKHSGASECTVTMDLSHGQLWTRVADNGIGRRCPDPAAGHGLSNMRERAKEHGGSCTAELGSRRGFAVTAVMPVPGRPPILTRAS